MPSPPSYGCCTRVNFVLKKHLLFQMNLSNSGLKNRSIKEYWLIFTVLKFPLGLQFSHNLTKFKIIKYISTIYIMTTTCTYLQQLTQVSDVAHGPLVFFFFGGGALGGVSGDGGAVDGWTDEQAQTNLPLQLLRSCGHNNAFMYKLCP